MFFIKQHKKEETTFSLVKSKTQFFINGGHLGKSNEEIINKCTFKLLFIVSILFLERGLNKNRSHYYNVATGVGGEKVIAIVQPNYGKINTVAKSCILLRWKLCVIVDFKDTFDSLIGTPTGNMHKFLPNF